MYECSSFLLAVIHVFWNAIILPTQFSSSDDDVEHNDADDDDSTNDNDNDDDKEKDVDRVVPCSGAWA